jgi:small-conductance mechanosensitive channel
VRTRDLASVVLSRLVSTAVVAMMFAVPYLRGADTADSVAKPSTRSANEGRIVFWNRLIAVQRGTLSGATAQERVERAIQRLAELPLSVKADEIVPRPIKIEDQDGIAVVCKGRALFFVGENDLDKESGESLEQAEQAALRNLNDALQARAAERSWPVIRSGLLFTSLGLLVFVSLSVVVWKASSRALALLRGKQQSFHVKLHFLGVDLLPYLAAVVYSLVRTIAWIFTLTAFFLWVTLSLRRFPYTEPWGNEAGGYVLHLLRQLGSTAVYSLPGVLAVFFVVLATRFIVRLARALFEQIATGGIHVSWMDADLARATHRIFAVVAWIFAVIVAYPYIPGSKTDAFKGISVFFGLVISLSSTGIVNQIMSGLFVVYSKALKTGEWVKVNDTEGEVLDVGLLAAKLRTIEGQEVTIPNSVLVGTSTTNYTRLGVPDGMIISSAVTIGYDAPWRQVQALLLRAADRTRNIRKVPEPYVLQRTLSDFYVAYTLIARLENERQRIETLSDLHSQIQDAFNEFGVQIMSPHFMAQPDENVLVPQSKWYAPPAKTGS